ncbi:hypothetical protein J5Y04_12355 [Kitasatospora sp. RG8]|uniref:hypothetical protein n=1 Tax=Kitasatospora sp. RG8 TaxID=2820815 RepID=UPI001ADF40BB|nr:hypothetical protein [Kitasatospora sp. RG8]MBP0450343.1 hypothetical protein [Kitasatospora sp. RG8]
MVTSSGTGSGGAGGPAGPNGRGGGGGSGGRRVLGYLESTRNLVGCAAGAGGLGLHLAGLGGAWWPGIVAALYGAGVLLWPGGQGGAGGRGGAGGQGGSGGRGGAGGPVPPQPRPVWTELEELRVYLRGVPRPPDPAKLDALLEGLLDRLAELGPGPGTEPVVGLRLPVAVDGYLRALTWERWRPGAGDPGAELAHEVELMAAGLTV